MEWFQEVLTKAVEKSPELATALVVVLIIVRMVMSALKSQGEKFADALKEGNESRSRAADACHATQLALANKFHDHASKSDLKTTEAIARCSAAVEASRRLQEDTNQLVQRCIVALGSFGKGPP